MAQGETSPEDALLSLKEEPFEDLDYAKIDFHRSVRQGAAEPYQGRLWQRSFHDHIIRNDREYRLIGEYIITNPARWREDCFYPSVLRPVQEGRTL